MATRTHVLPPGALWSGSHPRSSDRGVLGRERAWSPGSSDTVDRPGSSSPSPTPPGAPAPTRAGWRATPRRYSAAPPAAAAGAAGVVGGAVAASCWVIRKISSIVV